MTIYRASAGKTYPVQTSQCECLLNVCTLVVAFLVGFGAAAVLVRLGAALVAGFVLAEANILVKGTSESLSESSLMDIAFLGAG